MKRIEIIFSQALREDLLEWADVPPESRSIRSRNCGARSAWLACPHRARAQAANRAPAPPCALPAGRRLFQ